MFTHSRIAILGLAIAASLSLGFASPASAVPVKWTVDFGTFEDAGEFSGYFVYDADTGALGERTISVRDGNVVNFPATTYDNANSIVTYAPFGNPQPTLVMQLNGSNRQMRITPSSELTNAGGSVFINLQSAANGAGSAECFNCGPARRIVSGHLIGERVNVPFTLGPSLAGNWYDPAQNGHGIQFEVLPNNVATAFWFTFDNAGNQVWINAAGTIEGNRIVMDAGRVLNGRFPPNFNPAALERRHWGTLTFQFTDCVHGSVTWTSTDPAFTATGTMPLERLTTLSGLACQ